MRFASPRRAVAACYPAFVTWQSCSRSAAAPLSATFIIGFVPSPYDMRTAIDKSNIAGDVACAVAYQKGRQRADIGDDRRFVER
jgi:hypothetical protein